MDGESVRETVTWEAAASLARPTTDDQRPGCRLEKLMGHINGCVIAAKHTKFYDAFSFLQLCAFICRPKQTG